LDARFINTPKIAPGNHKRLKLDLSLTRQPWVDFCSAALPRGDIPPARLLQDLPGAAIQCTCEAELVLPPGGTGRARGSVRYHSEGSMKLNACNLLLAHMVYL
jgi:hypothetical protein